MLKIKRQVSIESLFDESWMYFVSAFAMYLVLCVITQVLPHNVFGLVIQVACGVIVYLAMLTVMRPKHLVEYIKQVKSSKTF